MGLRLRPLRAAAILLLASAPACHVDFTRIRDGNPLPLEPYERLEAGRTTLDDALATMGAPDDVEWRSGKDYLRYVHRDFTRLGVRFQSPVSFFGYRHTFAEIEGNLEEADEIALVFDEDGVLERKSVRFAEADAALAGDETDRGDEGWAWHLTPRYAWSPFLVGDGGEKDYDDLFDDGHVFGADLAVLPVPYFMILAGGNYQRHRGSDFRDRGREVELEDLELFQAEVGGRLLIPPEIIGVFWDLDEVRALLDRSDVRAHRGAFLFLHWTLSGTYADSVKVEIDGGDAGTYFDHSLRLSTTVGGGLEYSAGRFGAWIEVLYQTIGALEEGTADLDSDGGDIGGLLLGAGVSARF